MQADEAFALVGKDHQLTRDLSGGSFGNLFSEESSGRELALAMLERLLPVGPLPVVPVVPQSSSAMAAPTHAEPRAVASPPSPDRQVTGRTSALPSAEAGAPPSLPSVQTRPSVPVQPSVQSVQQQRRQQQQQQQQQQQAVAAMIAQAGMPPPGFPMSAPPSYHAAMSQALPTMPPQLPLTSALPSAIPRVAGESRAPPSVPASIMPGSAAHSLLGSSCCSALNAASSGMLSNSGGGFGGLNIGRYHGLSSNLSSSLNSLSNCLGSLSGGLVGTAISRGDSASSLGGLIRGDSASSLSGLLAGVGGGGGSGFGSSDRMSNLSAPGLSAAPAGLSSGGLSGGLNGGGGLAMSGGFASGAYPPLPSTDGDPLPPPSLASSSVASALNGNVPVAVPTGLHPSVSHNSSGAANATLVGLAHEAAVASAAASAASALSKGRSSKPSTGAHVAAAAAASAASRLIHAEAEASSGKATGSAHASSINRRTWSAEEDDTIRKCVEQMGPRWRQIAPLLPGRSDDSVRNRWKRLKEEADAAAQRRRGGPALSFADDSFAMSAASSTSSTTSISSHSRAAKRPAPEAADAAPKRQAASRQASIGSGRELDDDCENGQRISWSPHEDQIIVRAVQELGPRWCAVAERLPSRTDQAVRNRWNRLQQRARLQALTMLDAFKGSATA